MDIDQIIENYYRKPEFYREKPSFSKSVYLKNPLCGDLITLGYEGELLVFAHQGCVISNVGMSVLCDLHKQNIPEKYFTNEVFKILEKFPFREKCLTLAFDAYSKLLASTSA